MAKKSLTSLPWEVLGYILTFLPPSQLPSVILACRALRRLAEPILYRHISLSTSPTRCFYLLRTLLARDELCKHIQTFHPADRYTMPEQHFNFPFSRIIFRNRLSGDHQKAYYGHTERVVRRLCDVESLSIPGLAVSSENILNVLASLPQIKKFRTQSDAGQLGSLLDLLPSVTHLEIPFHPFHLSEGQVQPHHARHLEGLFCPTYVAISLIPSRPIKQLALYWCSNPFQHQGLSTWELMEVMGRGTAVVRSLGLFLGGHPDMPHQIENIFPATARFLPDVEELTIWITFWWQHSNHLTRILSELRDSLSSFRKLRTIDFNGSIAANVDGVPYFDHRRNAISAVYTHILQIWSERCPTLERVTFPNGAVWVKEPVLKVSKHRHPPLSFLRRTLFSVSWSPNNPISQEAKGSPEQDCSFENNSVSDNVGTPDVDTLATGSKTNINLSTIPSSPHPAHPKPESNNSTTTTAYKWRCLNPDSPHSNRASAWFTVRLQKSEFGWGTPMFERDLKVGWPEGLPVQIP